MSASPPPAALLETSSWLSAEEWHVLHSQIRPHTRPVDAFRNLVVNGQLSVYTRADMDRVFRKLKELLRQHGRLRDADAEGMKKSMSKGLLAEHIQKIVLLFPQAAPATQAAASTTQTASVETSLRTRPRPPPVDASTTTTSGRSKPVQPPAEVSDRIQPLLAPPENASTVDSHTPKEGTRHDAPCSAASQQEPQASGHAPLAAKFNASTTPGVGGACSSANGSSDSTVAHLERCLYSEVAKQKELLLRMQDNGSTTQAQRATTAFQPFESAMLSIEHTLGRIPVRGGLCTRDVLVPTEYANAIADRRMRLVLFPVEGSVSFAPAAWPAVRDVLVSVNRVTIKSTWRRSWPARSHDMRRSYLTLDVTSQFVRSSPRQHISLNCFAMDYQGVVVVAVALLRSEAAVVAARFGAGMTIGDASMAQRALARVYTAALQESVDAAREGDDAADVVVDAASSTITTKCPLSQVRIMVPARGSRCGHLQCFDLATYARVCHTACYWNCPLCDALLPIAETVVDPYIEEALRQFPDAKALRFAPTAEQHCRWAPAAVDVDEPPGRRLAAGSTVMPGGREHPSMDDVSSLESDTGGSSRHPGGRVSGSGAAVDPISID